MIDETITELVPLVGVKAGKPSLAAGLAAAWPAAGTVACSAPTLDTPSGVMETMRPSPSTWPETTWPPISSPSRAARSRLTPSPALQAPRVVLDRVSFDTSTANQPSPFSVTVRQQPAWLMEAPRSMPAVSQAVSIS